jgi:hypothetical protein
LRSDAPSRSRAPGGRAPGYPEACRHDVAGVEVPQTGQLGGHAGAARKQSFWLCRPRPTRSPR